jgi:hypothetical protein
VGLDEISGADVRNCRLTRWHRFAAFLVIAVASLAVAGPLMAETVKIPLPRPSPARVAPDADPATPVEPAELAEPTPEQTILLQGANSLFAESGIELPDGAPLPLTPDALATKPATDGAGAMAAAKELAENATPAQGGSSEAANIRPGAYTLEARLTADGPALGDGVIWRIFGDEPAVDGKMPLLGESKGGVIHVRLENGRYLIHAAYGRSGASRRIDVTGPTGSEVLVLESGGMRLLSINAHTQNLASDEVRFDIYSDDEGGSDERFLIVSGAPPGRVISLNAGVYHVVCRYGNANAIVRADIRVDSGKLTEATLYQTAARQTLKLVDERGGEAIADTRWTVVTPSGEDVVESVGAFPTVVLAAGEYTAFASNDGQIYEAEFTVEAGLHRDVEVMIR